MTEPQKPQAKTNTTVCSPSCGMTDAEITAMQHLVNFWNAYVMLPDTVGVIETTEVRHAVHKIQGVLAIRVARRANPEILG